MADSKIIVLDCCNVIQFFLLKVRYNFTTMFLYIKENFGIYSVTNEIHTLYSNVINTLSGLRPIHKN